MNCLLRLRLQVQALAELFVKQRDRQEGKKSSIFALYCFACFQSGILQDSSTKACTVPISC